MAKLRLQVHSLFIQVELHGSQHILDIISHLESELIASDILGTGVVETRFGTFSQMFDVVATPQGPEKLFKNNVLHQFDDFRASVGLFSLYLQEMQGDTGKIEDT